MESFLYCLGSKESVFEVGAAVINAQLGQTNQKLSKRGEYCVPMPISNLEALLYQLMQRKTCGCQLKKTWAAEHDITSCLLLSGYRILEHQLTALSKLILFYFYLNALLPLAH